MDMMDKDMDIGHRHVNWSILGSDMPSALGLVHLIILKPIKTILVFQGERQAVLIRSVRPHLRLLLHPALMLSSNTVGQLTASYIRCRNQKVDRDERMMMSMVMRRSRLARPTGLIPRTLRSM